MGSVDWHGACFILIVSPCLLYLGAAIKLPPLAAPFFLGRLELVGLAFPPATQLAKTTLFASGNEADVRKSAAGDFFQ